MKVTVIGTGYVGLVTGACLADVGHQVLCLDIDASKIARLMQGEIPIYEPGLDGIVARSIAAGRLSFTTDPKAAAEFGLIQMIAVGTPPDEDGSADLKHVVSAAAAIGRFMPEYRVIVDKSTVPVGTADLVEHSVRDALEQRGSNAKFTVVSNPEFLKEGAAIADFMRPDRIVIGTDDRRAEQLMRELYMPFQRNHDKVVVMSRRSAELTKYAANAMLATRISFMNELSVLAEKLGADIEDVRRGIGSDPRIGMSFIYPGTGYGGSCFPKDVSALVQMGIQNNQKLNLLEAVQIVNERQKSVLFRKAKNRFGDLRGLTFALWGLSFKPDTDDMREAPSITLIGDLLAAGAKVRAFDPIAAHEAKKLIGTPDGLAYLSNANQALAGSDALMIVTEWKEFRSPDFDFIKTTLKAPIIFDGRNMYSPESMAEKGIEYFGVGRGLSIERDFAH